MYLATKGICRQGIYTPSSLRMLSKREPSPCGRRGAIVRNCERRRQASEYPSLFQSIHTCITCEIVFGRDERASPPLELRSISWRLRHFADFHHLRPSQLSACLCSLRISSSLLPSPPRSSLELCSSEPPSNGRGEEEIWMIALAFRAWLLLRNRLE